jgi:hypothetical protein
MKPTIVQNEGQLSHYIQMTNKYGEPVYIPVVDVRDGVAERALGEQIIKAQNRSRYINYNQYHFSQKQDKKQFDI